MNDETKAFGLASREAGAPAPVLCGVRANGRLDGVLFDLTLRQTYRNTSDSVLEVFYTFPLPTQAVLMGFASELNGERKVGTVVAKRAAERQYEEALTEGDAPVMIEALDGGLHTANIGNLKPGDELVLEVRFAEALAFEQGRLRLSIPTTIAPRYGNAESAGLQPHQVPHASLLAECPLALSVTIAGALAGGIVECPTHRFTRETVEGGLRLDLAPGAWLDRDLVIVVKPREPLPSLVIQARDAVPHAAPVVVMAALQPHEAPHRLRSPRSDSAAPVATTSTYRHSFGSRPRRGSRHRSRPCWRPSSSICRMAAVSRVWPRTATPWNCIPTPVLRSIRRSHSGSASAMPG